MLGVYLWQQRLQGASLLDENFQWTWPHHGPETDTSPRGTSQHNSFRARMHARIRASMQLRVEKCRTYSSAAACLQAACRRSLHQPQLESDWVVL